MKKSITLKMYSHKQIATVGQQLENFQFFQKFES